MYSSLLDGVVTDPALMMVPVDDHVVHRGDGVFESMKFVAGGVYNLRAHLARLAHSAARVGLAPIPSDDVWTDRVRATVSASGLTDGMVRLLLTRGPGSFAANPYDCPAPSSYVIVYPMSQPSLADRRPHGVSIAASAVPIRSEWFAQIKSCNYLPNVMMKKEAVDRGVDFTVSFGEDGALAEGATETIMIVDETGRLAAPEPGRILEGTTMVRVMALAHDLAGSGLLRDVVRRPLSRADIEHAREILVVGTTIDVLPAITFDGNPVGDGKPGPVAAALRTALQHDIRHNTALRDP
jgi:branched-chain amino acid aminotransferase